MIGREPLHGEPRPNGPWVALALLPVVTLVVPASVVLSGPLQSNGWPPRLLIFWVAAATLLGWVAKRPRPGQPISPAEPGLLILLGALAVSLAAAGMRTLVEEEAAGVLRAALVMMPLVVVALGIARWADRRRVDVLLRGVVLGLGLSALVALAQQVAPFSFAELIRPPGFEAREAGGFGIRGDFTRVRGATAHPIEFGVLGGALLPVCIHYARFAQSALQRWMALGTSLVLFLAIPLTVSRSGVVVVAVSMALYALVLTNRQRANLAILAVMAALLARAAAPGLLGVIRSIFSNVGTDDSISGRTEDYDIIARLYDESPWIGHGLGTFRPDVYFFLDNQYLMTLVEGGGVLFVGTLVFFALALASARGARRRATCAEDVSLSQALLASIAAIALAGAFFDLFSFGQVTIVLFLLVGVAGALWRCAATDGRKLPRPLERVRAVQPAASLIPARGSSGPLRDWVKAPSDAARQ